MSHNTPTERSNIFPFLTYRDAPAAIEWLIKAFGFEKHSIHADTEGNIIHAELRLGPGVIMLHTAKDDFLNMKSPRDLAGVNQGISVYIEDVDAHYERAKAHGAEIVQALTDTSYGSREYCARDLEGHLWSFGTYQPAPVPTNE